MADRGLLGVAPLLGTDAKVYYDTIFTTTHLGRITDLISAKLRSPSTHELRLRMVLLRLMFEAYRRCAPQELGADPSQPLTRLDTPLSIECGVIDGKVGFSAAFPLESSDPAMAALQAGQFTADSSPALFSLLSELKSSCSELRVRAYEASAQVEVVAVIDLNAERAGLEDAAPVEAVISGEWVSKAAPDATKAKEYVQLGDLEYSELLKADDLGKERRKPKLGELLAEASQQAAQDAQKVSGRADEEGGLKKVQGGPEDEEESVRVKGEAKAGKKGWRSLFGGGSDDSGDESVGSTGAGTASGGLRPEVTAAYEAQIALLQQKLKELESRALVGGSTGADASNPMLIVRGGGSAQEPTGSLRVVSGGGSSQQNAATADGDQTVLPLAESAPGAAALPDALPPLEGTAPEGEATEEEEDEESIIQKILKKLFGDKKKKEDEAKLVPVPTPEEVPKLDVGADESIADASGKAMDNELGALEARIRKAQKDALELDSKDPKAKRMVEGLMADVMAEKGRLQELSKKVNLSVRQKEIEFRNKITLMQEEIRKKDEVLRQKEFALSRSKEQVGQLMAQVEKSKTIAKDSGEDGATKQKLAHVQKLLAGTKEENRLLSNKIEELKKQVTTMQMHARTRGAANQEFAAIQSKFEKTARQLEEFKRANQQLVEKLNRAEEKSKGGSQGAGADDAKKRLEASMRQLTLTKRESERLAAKVAEMQREDMRLRAEVTRLTGELKRATKGVTSPAPAAAPATAQTPGSTPAQGTASAAGTAAGKKKIVA